MTVFLPSTGSNLYFKSRPHTTQKSYAVGNSCGLLHRRLCFFFFCERILSREKWSDPFRPRTRPHGREELKGCKKQTVPHYYPRWKPGGVNSRGIRRISLGAMPNLTLIVSIPGAPHCRSILTIGPSRQDNFRRVMLR